MPKRTPAPRVVLADGGQGQVAVMPRLAMPSAQMQAIEGLRAEVGVEGGLLVHRVRYQGRTHTAYAQLEGPERHLAFNPQRRRFEEVSSSLLVRLASDQHLERVIEASGAVGGKAYPTLGWTLLQLPPEANPAAVAQTLQSNPLVEGARIILQGDVVVPQRIPRPPELAASVPLPDGQPLDAKPNVASDLLGIFGDAVIGATEIAIDALVYNWGGISSTATDFVVAINDQPHWSDTVLWRGRGRSAAPGSGKPAWLTPSQWPSTALRPDGTTT